MNRDCRIDHVHVRQIGVRRTRDCDVDARNDVFRQSCDRRIGYGRDRRIGGRRTRGDVQARNGDDDIGARNAAIRRTDRRRKDATVGEQVR